MKQMKDTKKINLQRRKRKLADLLEKERLEHTVRNVQKSYIIYYIDNRRRHTMAINMCSFLVTFFLNTNINALFFTFSGSTQGLLEGQLCSD